MKLTCALVAMALALSSVAALAGNACYTPAQERAEQLLRLHSELMVITVTCKQGSQGEDLGAAYGAFTQKNIGVLHDAEQTMTAYYKATAKGNAVDRLDRLRTILANEFGQKAADMSAPRFCEVYRDKVLQFSAASHADVENQVEAMQISEHSYVKLCTAKTGAVKKGG